MAYRIIISDGYIQAFSTYGGVEITAEVQDSILQKMADAPTAPSGYTYKLRADNLEWELVELPPAPEYAPSEDEALTRYANELTNGNAETLQEATENLIKIVKEDK
jgi:hypothetical protein